MRRRLLSVRWLRLLRGLGLLRCTGLLRAPGIRLRASGLLCGPAYAYYAPPAYYAPSPAYYAPPAYGYPYANPYARPYYFGRGGHVDAIHNGRPRGDVPTGNVAKRGIYASAANPGLRGIKAPAPNYNPVKVSGFPAKQKKPGSNVPAAGYAVQGKLTPTAYYAGPGGYVGPRR